MLAGIRRPGNPRSWNTSRITVLVMVVVALVCAHQYYSLHNHAHDLNNLLETANQALREREANIQEVGTKEKTCQVQLRNEQGRLSKLQETSSDRQKSLLAEILTVKEQSSDWKKKHGETQALLSRAQDEGNEKANTIASLNSELAGLRAELEKERAELEKERAERGSLEKKLTELSDELERVKETWQSDIDEQHKDAEHDLDVQRKQCEAELESMRKAAETDIASMKVIADEAAATAKAAAEKTISQLKQLNHDDVSHLTMEIEKVSAQLDQCRIQKTALADSLAEQKAAGGAAQKKAVPADAAADANAAAAVVPGVSSSAGAPAGKPSSSSSTAPPPSPKSSSTTASAEKAPLFGAKGEVPPAAVANAAGNPAVVSDSLGDAHGNVDKAAEDKDGDIVWEDGEDGADSKDAPAQDGAAVPANPRFEESKVGLAIPPGANDPAAPAVPAAGEQHEVEEVEVVVDEHKGAMAGPPRGDDADAAAAAAAAADEHKGAMAGPPQGHDAEIEAEEEKGIDEAALKEQHDKEVELAIADEPHKVHIRKDILDHIHDAHLNALEDHEAEKDDNKDEPDDPVMDHRELQKDGAPDSNKVDNEEEEEEELGVDVRGVEKNQEEEEDAHVGNEEDQGKDEDEEEEEEEQGDDQPDDPADGKAHEEDPAVEEVNVEEIAPQ